ncbi:UNVERIFIED_CONTAM: hypothetical protein Sradi_2654200 [Sesamum radiatum]|uniref:Uncharacterized protein n=1 Tax=Sesamum radiatum TaxID=300843 RepID=A0AAW2S6I0_SESRA
MVIDAIGPICPPVHVSHQSNENEIGMSSNDRGGGFLDVVNATNQPLYSERENHSQLSAVTSLVNIKSEYNLPQSCYDEISQLIGELLPRDHTLAKEYYSTKKLIRELGLLVEKIDACKAGCMLFWKDDKHLEFCKFCGNASQTLFSFLILLLSSSLPTILPLISNAAVHSHAAVGDQPTVKPSSLSHSSSLPLFSPLFLVSFPTPSATAMPPPESRLHLAVELSQPCPSSMPSVV